LFSSSSTTNISGFAQLSFIVTRIEHKLAEAAKASKPHEPFLTIDGTRVSTLRELVELLDSTLVSQWVTAALAKRSAWFRHSASAIFVF